MYWRKTIPWNVQKKSIKNQMNSYTIVLNTKVEENALQIPVSSVSHIVTGSFEAEVLIDSAPSLTSHCITRMSEVIAWHSLTSMARHMVTNRIPEDSEIIVIILGKIYVNIGLLMEKRSVSVQLYMLLSCHC